MTKRREFLIKAGLGALGISAIPSIATSSEHAPPTTYRIGIAGYSFKELSLDNSIELMKVLGITHFSIKDFHLPLNSDQGEIKLFHNKLSESEMVGYCVGPIRMRSKAEVDVAFNYALRVGVPMMIGVPEYHLLPYVEDLVKQHDIKLAIHNHGPDNLPYPTAGFIMDKIGNLDPRLGICLDIGHNIRGGEDPVAAITSYAHRLFDMHIKDVTAAELAGKNIEIGRGIIDIPNVFRTLNNVGYQGVCSIEYEREMKTPLAGIAESFGYLKGVIDSI